ncbi:glycosyltransferase [Streptococcus rubneri]|uniref:glycosyltransferase n=1 Tax=Streptococcus rubneri TaxID=1234680 RepID=UPI0039C3E528
MKRDIIFVTHHLGGIGGVQRVVDQLATRFAEDGNKVTVVGCAVQSQEKYEKVQKNYQEILLYQEDIFFEKPWLFLKEKYLSKKLEKELTDLLSQSQDPIIILANPIVYLLMGKTFKNFSNNTIFIGQMHSSADFVLECKGIYKVYPYIIKNKYPKLDCIMFLSDSYSEVISNHYNIPLEKFVAIPNPLPRYIKVSEELHQEKSKVISFVGRLDPVKQIDHQIQAFAQVADEFPDVIFNIYGSGNLSETLQSLINQLGMTNCIFLKGKTTHVKEVYKESLYTLLTSKSEAFPMSVVESMITGTPVLTYNCSQGVDELQTATPEMLFEPSIEELATKMRHYLTNPYLLEDIGRRGREYVIGTYAEDIIIQKWYDLFQKLEEKKGIT